MMMTVIGALKRGMKMPKLKLFLILIFLVGFVESQAPGYPGHYYGANQASIRTNQVPPRELWPEPLRDPRTSTLRPHLCTFNPFIRKCMDPNNYCPGRCMNFNYVFNARYDCRCLISHRICGLEAKTTDVNLKGSDVRVFLNNQAEAQHSIKKKPLTS